MRKLQKNKYDYEKENYKLPITIEEDLTLLVIREIQIKTRYKFLPIRLIQRKMVTAQLTEVRGSRPSPWHKPFHKTGRVSVATSI